MEPSGKDGRFGGCRKIGFLGVGERVLTLTMIYCDNDIANTLRWLISLIVLTLSTSHRHRKSRRPFSRPARHAQGCFKNSVFVSVMALLGWNKDIIVSCSDHGYCAVRGSPCRLAGLVCLEV